MRNTNLPLDKSHFITGGYTTLISMYMSKDLLVDVDKVMEETGRARDEIRKHSSRNHLCKSNKKK